MPGRGVSACATCDGFFFRGQKVAIVGGGNTAVEEALYLSHIAAHVTLIHRRDKLRAEKIMQDRLFKEVEAGKMSVIWNHTIDEVLGDGIQGGSPGYASAPSPGGTRRASLPSPGLFIAIGHTPNTTLFTGQLAMHEGGYFAIRSGTEGNATAPRASRGVCRGRRGGPRLPPGDQLGGCRPAWRPSMRTVTWRCSTRAAAANAHTPYIERHAQGHGANPCEHSGA